MSQRRIGSVNNELDAEKRKYIIEMRKSLIKDDIIFNDGSLNLKYFNVKKGQYWSKRENKRLVDGVLQYGIAYKEIKNRMFPNWTETEIRLRICRLLKVYNIEEQYEGRKFSSVAEIMDEARLNKQAAQENKKLLGGIHFNPPPMESAEDMMNKFFFPNKK